MATQSLTRLLSKPKSVTYLLSRRFSASAAATTTTTSPAVARSRLFLPPLSSATPSFNPRRLSLRGFSADAATSAPAAEEEKKPKDEKDKEKEKDPDPEIYLDGCDFQHWLVIMEKPKGDASRDEIIDSYVKTLAEIVGGEEEARKRIYSVSTKCYYAFGFVGEKELSEKINELPNVHFTVPDSYLDARNKDYGGEPFIDGKAVPYDPKYHKDWVRNNSQQAKSEATTKTPRRNSDQPRSNNQSGGRSAQPKPSN